MAMNDRSMRLAWLMLVAWNVPVPLILGWVGTDWGARLGMFAAIPVFYCLGGWLFRKMRAIQQTIVWGGLTVVLSQLFPLLHIFAGAGALGAGERLGLPVEDERATGLIAGFVVTLLTGAILLTAAAVIGLGLQSVVYIGKKFPDPYTKRHMKRDDLA
jgi:hypothetical protein